jgi:hypothetical protein
MTESELTCYDDAKSRGCDCDPEVSTDPKPKLIVDETGEIHEVEAIWVSHDNWCKLARAENAEMN